MRAHSHATFCACGRPSSCAVQERFLVEWLRGAASSQGRGVTFFKEKKGCNVSCIVADSDAWAFLKFSKILVRISIVPTYHMYQYSTSSLCGIVR